MKRKITPGKIIYWGIAVLWFVTAIFPLYFTFISSFKDNSEIFKDFLVPTLSPTFENYIMAEKMAGILRATLNSLMVSVSAIAIMLIVCTMAAYVIARHKVPFAGFFSALFIAALTIPVQSAIIPIVQMVSNAGLKNHLWTLVIIYSGLNMALVFFIMKNSIEAIPSDLDEAAMIDGCSLIQIIMKVMIPVVKPSMATCAIITFLFTYNELQIANVLINDRALRTVSVALLSLKGDFGVLYSVIFAAVIISMIPTVTVYLLAQEKVEKSIASGMIKG
ncbi:MAG TPA: carbohydrate ABC transporter permease [Firmicutes bacterium]|nr:carbohydrate ABC transporter permease [Bacillota bacterium]